MRRSLFHLDRKNRKKGEDKDKGHGGSQTGKKNSLLGEREERKRRESRQTLRLKKRISVRREEREKAALSPRKKGVADVALVVGRKKKATRSETQSVHVQAGEIKKGKKGRTRRSSARSERSDLAALLREGEEKQNEGGNQESRSCTAKQTGRGKGRGPSTKPVSGLTRGLAK